jgi:hypothetical protein
MRAWVRDRCSVLLGPSVDPALVSKTRLDRQPDPGYGCAPGSVIVVVFRSDQVSIPPSFNMRDGQMVHRELRLARWK